MEIKLKTKEGLVDPIIEIVDGVMVVSPKEEKFEPKDGDFVTYMNGDKATIYVFAGGCKYNTAFYVAYSGLRNEVFKTLKGHLDMNRDDIRPATEEEKQKLFDKLNKEGYEWDADKKELVKLRWEPKVGEDYYTPSWSWYAFEPYLYGWTEEEFDLKCHSIGWVFKTKEECQAFCDKLNEAINSVKP